MSFGSKKVGILGQRSDQLVADRRDSLFETNWDELVIRFDRKTQGYRVMTAVQDGARSSAEESQDDFSMQTAKAAASDV